MPCFEEEEAEEEGVVSFLVDAARGQRPICLLAGCLLSLCSPSRAGHHDRLCHGNRRLKADSEIPTSRSLAR
jgi:hypothetical protein